MKKNTLLSTLAAFLLPGLWACSGKGNADTIVENHTADTLTRHARYLTIAKIHDGTVRVDIADPWNDGQYLARYLFVDKDSTLPCHVPPQLTIVRTPVSRAAIFSAVHTQAFDELGALDAIAAVADAKYFRKSDTIASLIEAGRIIDVGSVQLPSAERIAASGAEVVLRSPQPDASAATIPPTAVDILCADYMETSPKARAEWLLLLGELTGRGTEARRIFDAVDSSYSALASRAANAARRPKVLVESEQSGVWYVPAADSYMARLIMDAGGDYPWANRKGTGSIPLSLEIVARDALDADVWLIKTYGYTPTAETLIAQNPRYAAFKALKNKQVYGCNTSIAPYYNDIAFHPERILADYVAIFHPETMPEYKLQYFTNQQ